VAKRERSIVWLVALILLGAIGALWAYKINDIDPDAVKAEFAARIDELNRMPDERIVQKDALALEYLANEQYKRYAKALWLKLERAEKSFHDAAQLDRAAQKEVPPFLARSKGFSSTNHEDFKLLIGEARTLISTYGATRFGDPLRKRLDELTAKLEVLPKPASPFDFVELSREVATAQAQGRFSDALDRIDAFMKRPNAKEYAAKAALLTESTRSKAGTAADSVVEKAKLLYVRGDRSTALQLLDRTQPDFRRFPKETAALEEVRRTVTQVMRR
jgi:hypothetical protein